MLGGTGNGGMTGKAMLVVTLAGVLVGAAMVGCRSPGVSKDNYERVRMGMTLAEVEKILGPGTGGPATAGRLRHMGGRGAVHFWQDGEKKIVVIFQDGKAIDKIIMGFH